jgi:hypothetical protein
MRILTNAWFCALFCLVIAELVFFHSPTAGGSSTEAPKVIVSSPPQVGAPQSAAPKAMVDLAAHGYFEQEYFIEGTARKYAPSGNWTSDGVWPTSVAGQEKYKTRILIRAPISPRKFNGTVVVEWFNVTRGFDAESNFGQLWPEILDGGYAWVGVSAQKVGIDALKAEKAFGPGQAPVGNAVRYASLLSTSTDGFSYDIFSQAAEAVHDQAQLVLHGLRPSRMIGVGTSQSAARLVTYVDAIQPRDHVFQGFLIHARGARGGPIDDVIGGATTNVPSPSLMRTDLNVPVFIVESERDVSGYFPARQPDSSKFREWEVAGTAHSPRFRNVYSYAQLGLPLDVQRCKMPENDMPMHYVLGAALSHLNDWIINGKAPPAFPHIDVKGGVDGASGEVQRDRYGNGIGGIRLPQLVVPTARYSPDGAPLDPNDASEKLICTLAGLVQVWTNQAQPAGVAGDPWPTPSLKTLYPTHAAYLAAIKKAEREAIASGYLLERDGKATVEEASKSDIGN